jgi:hypothetical protein
MLTALGKSGMVRSHDRAGNQTRLKVRKRPHKGEQSERDSEGLMEKGVLARPRDGRHLWIAAGMAMQDRLAKDRTEK